jgi:hypothetical protein
MSSGLNQCWQPNSALEATRMKPRAPQRGRWAAIERGTGGVSVER